MECLECKATNFEEAHTCERCHASLRPARAMLYLDRATTAAHNSRYDLATAHLSQADVEMLALSQAERDHYLLTARAFQIQGLIYYANGRIDDAKAEILLAVQNLEQQHEGDELLATALGRLGNISYYQGELDSAISYYKRSSDSAVQAKSHVVAAKTLTNMSMIHLERGELEEAKIGYAAALGQADLSGDPTTIAEAYRLLSWYHASYGPFGNALDYIGKSLSLLPKIEQSEQRSIILGDAANIYARSGDLERAKQYMSEAYDLAQQSGSELAKEHAAISLAELMRRNIEPEVWFSKAMKAIEAPVHGAMMKREASLHLAVYYAYSGELIHARRHFQVLDNMSISEAAATSSTVDHTKALLYTALGEWGHATTYFKLAQKQGKFSLYDQAVAWEEYATMLLRRAEAEANPRWCREAESALGQAIVLFGELGLPLRVAQAQAMLKGELGLMLPNELKQPVGVEWSISSAKEGEWLPHGTEGRTIILHTVQQFNFV